MADQTVDYSTFKTIIQGKNLSWQYVNNSNAYDIFCVDGVVVWHTTVYLSGFEPIGINVSTNTTSRTDFETNFKSTANTNADSKAIFNILGGIITANGQMVIAPVWGASGCSMSMSGTYAGAALAFEISNDNQATWYAINGESSLLDTSYGSSVSGATNLTRLYFFSFAAVTHFRARCTAFTSGLLSITVTSGNVSPNEIIAIGDVLQGNNESNLSPLKVGGTARTTLPTSVADQTRIAQTYDKLGRAIIVPSQRELITTNAITLTTTTETTLLTAAGAGIFLDLVNLVVANNAAVAQTIKIRDATGGTIRFNIVLATNASIAIPLSPPFPQAAANNNWTAQLTTASSSTFITAMAIQNR